MMKIINERENIKRFDSLENNETFLYDDALYIKTDLPGDYNAFCLNPRFPHVTIFCDLTEVEPVNIDIIIK